MDSICDLNNGVKHDLLSGTTSPWKNLGNLETLPQRIHTEVARSNTVVNVIPIVRVGFYKPTDRFVGAEVWECLKKVKVWRDTCDLGMKTKRCE